MGLELLSDCAIRSVEGAASSAPTDSIRESKSKPI